MEHKLIDLSFSLFCSKSVWHTVLTKAIKPYLSEFTKVITNYRVEFNYLCGENIRLAVQCNYDAAEDLAQQSDSFFKSFFSVSNLPPRILELPVKGVFLPFNSNTIRYGLYEPGHTKIFSTKFSDVIIQALGEDEIDDENIITFAFYLSLGLIRIQNTCINNEPLLNYTVTGNADITTELLAEKYVLHKSGLGDIYDEVLLQEREAFENYAPWLDKWLTLCTLEMSQPSLGLTSPAANITHQIRKQLGISENMNLMLNYFLKCVLAESADVSNDKG